MNWDQTAKLEWQASMGDGTLLRVQAVGLARDRDFCAYRGRAYLGSEPTLEAAQARAEAGEAKERAAPAAQAPVAPAPEGEPATRRKAAGKALTSGGSRLAVLEAGNPCAPGSKRYAQYDLAKRCATRAEFKSGGGAKTELDLFVKRGWIRLDE